MGEIISHQTKKKICDKVCMQIHGLKVIGVNAHVSQRVLQTR